ncbi:MAG: gene transfer agent family protein [Sandaracinobacteroides sp.]
MSGANSLRGEVILRLGSGDRLLRPTFAALVAAETEIGSLFRLLERVAAEDVRLTEMAALFWHCLADKGERVQFEEELVAAGPATLLPTYRALLVAVFRTG